jgi:4a-hydroxytetrahydrobiopterin dehydratase
MATIQNEISKLTNWQQNGIYLTRTIIFKSFRDALAMMQVIGLFCDEINHHPEWKNVYNKLEIKLTTHDTGDISEKDIQLAKKIDDLIP